MPTTPNTPKRITNAGELYHEELDTLAYNVDPVFEFATEVDALGVLQQLSWDLEAAREQERQVLRYMAAAVRAAAAGTSEDGPVSPEAITGHAGVNRQRVDNWLTNET